MCGYGRSVLEILFGIGEGEKTNTVLHENIMWFDIRVSQLSVFILLSSEM
jgi:hypothetical protein